MIDNNKPSWLKSKGYLHITSQIEVDKQAEKLLSLIKNADYISKYAFYPLLHSSIKERRYKRISSDSTIRAHSYKDENGNTQRSLKERPLHYATHMDALIFGHYAEIIQTKYEERINLINGLADCVIAYRKIPSEIEGKHKSTIHFAYEFFEEIKHRTEAKEECVVLTFDIKSFFSSLDHQILKNAWCDIIGEKKLPADHYNVFKASTLFSYILLDDLRTQKKRSFDEKELARIRNNYGINALFESPKAFRDKVKAGTIKLYKYPFRNKKIPVGIPQGLPISATLANLYLLSFDIKILNALVSELGAYYRRYSDDIVIICSKEHADFIEAFITSGIEESKVGISYNKTEKFVFKKMKLGNKEPRLTCIKIINGKEHIGSPLNYLGFEFNGQKALIKSANLAKFYRRMISSVKSKARRAKKQEQQNHGIKTAVFRRQLYKLYTTRPLSHTKIRSRWKRLIKNKFGSYTLITGNKDKVLRSNYLSYVERASEIMKEPAIKNQIRKHKAIFNQAINKHLK